MRAFASGGGFDVQAIAGSHFVLLAIDATPQARNGLLGFALKRTEKAANRAAAAGRATLFHPRSSDPEFFVGRLQRKAGPRL